MTAFSMASIQVLERRAARGVQRLVARSAPFAGNPL